MKLLRNLSFALFLISVFQIPTVDVKAGGEYCDYDAVSGTNPYRERWQCFYEGSCSGHLYQDCYDDGWNTFSPNFSTECFEPSESADDNVMQTGFCIAVPTL